MLPPILSQNSRQLLHRFFARESRLALVAAATTSSSSPSSSQASTSTAIVHPFESNPFKGQLLKNERGHSIYRSPRYSLRRQKQLLKAMEVVKLQEELFSPVSEQQVQRQQSSEGGEEETVLVQNAFKVPTEWSLPSSKKAKKLPSFFTEDQDPSQTSPRKTATVKEATTRGPYKGRKEDEKPFKLHKWELNREKVRAERKMKLDNMPERIADYRQVSPNHHILHA